MSAIKIAKQFQTPLYVLDEQKIRANCRDYVQAFAKHYPLRTHIAYAAKAFLVKAICPIIQEEGLRLDVASLGELSTALAAKFPADKIYLHGNCKSREELNAALTHKIYRIVVDNEDELNDINELARKKKTIANILLRLIPGVEAHTHEYIKTGQTDTKFGIPTENGVALKVIQKALKMPNIKLHGFHSHIGSQIFELESFVVASEIMFEFLHQIRLKTGKTFPELSLGGGLGIAYLPEHHPPSKEEFAKVLSKAAIDSARKLNYPLPTLTIEPGRSIVGDAGITLYTIRYIKPILGERTYVIVDGGLSDNPRPALYGANYHMVVANRSDQKADFLCTISGKHCETDTLFKNVHIAKPKRGDILAVFSTGAYNHSMASNYNRYPRPAVVLVNGNKARVIYRRETIKDLMKQDV